MKEYLTLSQNVSTYELVIEKSRFLAYCKGVDDTEQAISFVADIRKKHYDATHNCYAYVCDEIAKCSDDGEPQGTAGVPISERIKANGLNRVCVVVTRYFGGVKLGVGGLFRAYGGAAGAVLERAAVVKMSDCMRVTVRTKYSDLKPLQNVLRKKSKLLKADYGSEVNLEYLILAKRHDTISNIVQEISNGKAHFDVRERLLCPYEEDL